MSHITTVAELATVVPRILLRVLVGSTVHGTHVDDGLEDRDEMAVAIEPLSQVICSERDRFSHLIYRTAEEREGRVGVRSVAGDLDLVVYSLRKWTRLALASNPTVLLLLHSPVVVSTMPAGDTLRALAPHFASKRAGATFRGYMDAQRKKLNGERGGMRVTRQELIDRHGYDTKFAMQMLRLGYQGIEYLTTGSLQLPMKPELASFLRGVRLGSLSLSDVNRLAHDLDADLTTAIETSPLPDEPNEALVWREVQRLYRDTWRGDAEVERMKELGQQ